MSSDTVLTIFRIGPLQLMHLVWLKKKPPLQTFYQPKLGKNMNSFIPFLMSIMLISIFSDVPGQTISFMTFNIRYDNPGDKENAWGVRKDDVVGMLMRYHPDFLGIQEGKYHQVEYLLEHLSGYKYIGVGRDNGAQEGEYCAIYYDSTKFELLAQETFWLSDTPDKVSVGWDAAMERICTYGKFKDSQYGDTLHIFNTHFDHMGSTARSKSAELILQKIEAYGLKHAHLILMGDFNSPPGSVPVERLKGGLNYGLDISRKELQGPAGTYNAFDINKEMKESIDYIFTKRFEVLSYQHIDERRVGGLYMSDHLPVLIEVKVNGLRK